MSCFFLSKFYLLPKYLLYPNYFVCAVREVRPAYINTYPSASTGKMFPAIRTWYQSYPFLIKAPCKLLLALAMSSTSGASQTSLNSQVTEKLTRTNYVLWRTQVIPQLRGAGVYGYINGTQSEPAKLLVTTKDGKEVSSTPNPLHPI